MELPAIAALAHKAEDLVDVFRGDAGRVEPACIDLLLATGDALADMVQASGRNERPPADADLMKRLVDMARRLKAGLPLVPGPAARAAAPGRAAAPRPPPRRRPTAEAAAEPPPTPPPPPAAEPEPHAGPVQRLRLEVEIAPACPVPAVRAFLVVKKLSALGAGLASAPAVEELKAGRLPDGRITVWLETAEPVERLKRALGQISDLGRVEIEVEAAQAEPAGPGRGRPRGRVGRRAEPHGAGAHRDPRRLRRRGGRAPAGHRPHPRGGARPARRTTGRRSTRAWTGSTPSSRTCTTRSWRCA